MKCDKCIHWGCEERPWEQRHEFKICYKAVMMDEAFEWEDENGNIQDTPKDPSVKMYVQDGSSYFAALYTAPDFFCAHFEEKDDA